MPSRAGCISLVKESPFPSTSGQKTSYPKTCKGLSVKLRTLALPHSKNGDYGQNVSVDSLETKQRTSAKYFKLSSRGLDCKTVRIFAYSSKREQSNERSGTRLKTESETGERR